MAWLGIFLSTWIRKSTQFVMSGSKLFLPQYTRGKKKNIWSELESNPGPLASHSQTTALTTGPWLLGQGTSWWKGPMAGWSWVWAYKNGNLRSAALGALGLGYILVRTTLKTLLPSELNFGFGHFATDQFTDGEHLRILITKNACLSLWCLNGS